MLEAMLTGHVVAADAVPAHYSIRFAAPSDAPVHTQPLHLVYDGSCLEMRTLSARAALEAVSDMVSVHTQLESELALVHATALLDTEGYAVLLPPFVRARAVEMERGLNRLGFRLVHSGRIRFALDAGALVINPPALHVDWRVAEPPFHVDEANRRPRTEPGRYPVRRWYLYDQDHQERGSRLPRGAGLRAAMRNLVDIGGRPAGLVTPTVSSVIALMGRVEFLAAGDADSSALINHVTRHTVPPIGS